MVDLSNDLQHYITLLPGFLQNPDPEIYRSNNYVYLDFETTNLDKGSPYNKENRLIFTAWRLGEDHPNYVGKHLTYNWGSEYEQDALVRACEKAEFIVAHNVKFELGWLRRCGLDTTRVLVWCTQIGEYVIAGNRQWRLNLDASLARNNIPGKLGVISKLMKAGTCPSDMPTKWLKKYGLLDVYRGHQLFIQQRRNIFVDALQAVQFTRCLLTPALEDIERTGMHLDEDRVRIVHKKYSNRLHILQTEMDELTGGINTKSTPQKANFLYNVLKFPIPKDFRGKELRGKPPTNPKTVSYQYFPDGTPTTDSKYVSRFKSKNKKQAKFLELLSEINKVKDAKSKSLDKFLACVEETEDNILHAQFNQTITSTQRLSSTGLHYKAQFQNFARIFKPLFNARTPGWEIGEIDEAQLEYRAAVYLGQDKVGLEDILNNVDAHGFTASIIFKEDWEECNGDKSSKLGKYVRTESKSHTFKPLYGGKSGTPREREYYEAFKQKHKGITNVQNDWLQEVYAKKQLRIPSGLIFYWEDAKINSKGTLIRPDGRPIDQSVCNYPVQSLATADIVPVGVTMQWHLLKVAEMQSFLVSTIHDSTIGEVFPPERELYQEIGVYSMVDYIYKYLNDVYDIDFNVPLEAEAEFNVNWANSPYWEEEFLAA